MSLSTGSVLTMNRVRRPGSLFALLLVGIVAGALLLVPPESGNDENPPEQSSEQPTTGWGENNRAWGDDEFWMDMTTAGLQGLFTLLTIGGAVWLYRRQRFDSKQDAMQEEYEALTADMKKVLADVAGEVRFFANLLKKSPTDENYAYVWKQYEALRPRVEALRQYAPMLESDFPIVASNVRQATEAVDQYGRGALALYSVPYRQRGVTASGMLDSRGSLLTRLLRDLYSDHKKGFHRIQRQPWPSDRDFAGRIKKLVDLTPSTEPREGKRR
jgi:hypothetical protein